MRKNTNIRTTNEIIRMANKLVVRALSQLCQSSKTIPQTRKSKLLQNVEKEVKRVLEKFGEKNLKPLSDYEWGRLNGRYEALLWVLGLSWKEIENPDLAKATRELENFLKSSKAKPKKK